MAQPPNEKNSGFETFVTCHPKRCAQCRAANSWSSSWWDVGILSCFCWSVLSQKPTWTNMAKICFRPEDGAVLWPRPWCTEPGHCLCFVFLHHRFQILWFVIVQLRFKRPLPEKERSVLAWVPLLEVQWCYSHCHGVGPGNLTGCKETEGKTICHDSAENLLHFFGRHGNVLPFWALRFLAILAGRAATWGFFDKRFLEVSLSWSSWSSSESYMQCTWNTIPLVWVTINWWFFSTRGIAMPRSLWKMENQPTTDLPVLTPRCN